MLREYDRQKWDLAVSLIATLGLQTMRSNYMKTWCLKAVACRLFIII